MDTKNINCQTCGYEMPQAFAYCPQCGYAVDGEREEAVAPVTEAGREAPGAPGVVYLQPAAAREVNWAPWLALTIVVMLAAVVLLWNQGYLRAWEPAEPAATNVTIDNSPQMSGARPPDGMNPGAIPPAGPQPPPEPALPEGEPAVLPPALDIISINGKALETAGPEWKYGYTMRVRNNTLAPVTASFRVQFLDTEEYPVDDDLVEGILIPADSEIEVSDFDMIPAELAERINSLLVEQR